MAVTHAKVSAVSDGGDTSLVRPSDWNADHVVPSGAVVQVKTAISTSDDTTTTASMQNSSLSLAFTPLYGDSILVIRVDGVCSAERVAGTISGRSMQVEIYNSTDAAVVVGAWRGINLVAASAVAAFGWYTIGLCGTYTVNSTAARTFRLRYMTNTVTNIQAGIHGATYGAAVMTIMETRP